MMQFLPSIYIDCHFTILPIFFYLSQIGSLQSEIVRQLAARIFEAIFGGERQFSRCEERSVGGGIGRRRQGEIRPPYDPGRWGTRHFHNCVVLKITHFTVNYAEGWKSNGNSSFIFMDLGSLIIEMNRIQIKSFRKSEHNSSFLEK